MDDLARHIAVTEHFDWQHLPDELTQRMAALVPTGCRDIGVDPHAEFITKWDQPRDFKRASRLSKALAIVRNIARCGQAVDWPVLQEVQRVVLGGAAEFRQGEAYAKGGDEKYGIWPGLEGQFANKIAADSQDRAHPIAKAARIYLDICFFHPFQDGNARAARLWFDHFLSRGGFTPAFVEPLFVVERFAGDPRAYASFLRLAVLACERAQH